jgi:GNAT superfamily N-acetyltransferase
MINLTLENEGFVITTDRARMDVKAIHSFLSEKSYWSKGISIEKVQRAIDNSLNFGVFCGDMQIGFARIITDYSLLAYLADVFIIEEYRGRGLSKWLMQTITAHPDLQGLKKWVLVTKDAHGLYEKFGWKPLAYPQIWMEKLNPDPGKE